MNAEKLSALPDWPALMDRETAILYLGGRKTIFEKLLNEGLLEHLTKGHRSVSFRRVDIDTALAAMALREGEK